MSNALDRLLNSSSEPQAEYSLEEQMASAIANTEEEDDDFSDMSDAAKKAFFGGGATEITFSEPQEPVIPQEQPVQQPTTPPLTQFINQQVTQTQEVKQEPIKQETVQPQPTFAQPMTQMLDDEEDEGETYSEPIAPQVTEPVAPPPQQQVQPVVEQPKKKAGRPPKKAPVVEQPRVEQPTVVRQEVKQETQVANSIIDDMFIPVMNQLAKDLIDNLKQNDYKISRFNTSQMEILYNYMYTKF